MTSTIPSAPGRVRRAIGSATLIALAAAAIGPAAQAQTLLADSPPFATPIVPGNVALPLSVEYPTVQRAAYTSAYATTTEYLGYFDPNKCYTYNYAASDTGLQPAANPTTTTVNYFQPAGAATSHTCSGKWSGNFLNWSLTPTIDPFRWALTGGFRVVDTATLTVLEKAWSDTHTGLFPDKTITGTLVSGATPYNYANFIVRVDGKGNKMLFSGTTANIGSTATVYNPSDSTISASGTYQAYARVRVCDSTSGNGGVETNCVQYGSNWKPQGLMQTYANKMRFSVFGYLNDDDQLLDGGVMRASQKFIGPTMPVPGALPQTNTQAEWDSATGIFATNPNPADATATNNAFAPSPSVVNSGVMNYVNKFGEIAPSASYTFKSYDPVSELYYTALRYFKHLGTPVGGLVPSVPEYSSTPLNGASVANRTKWIDSFPVITGWDDPIQYSCQRNFMLGIGDINTWNDKNLPGTGTGTTSEPTKPSLVVSDTTVDSVAATSNAFTLEGLAIPNANSYSGRNNSAGIVGLAYDAHTKDIRSDLTGTQTVDTYWVDVQETGYVSKNQFYLAAKYGGFAVPTNYDSYTNTTPLTTAWWHTVTGSPDTNVVGSDLRPDNYYPGGRPDLLVAGLNAAFSKIASQLTAFTTAGAVALPAVAASNNASYGAKYDSSSWTGDVTYNNLSFVGTTSTSQSTQWSFATQLASQLSGTGWDTNRRVATWNGSQGVQFCSTGATTNCPATSQITATQLAALDPSYTSPGDSLAYLKYLRGDTSNAAYRARVSLVGDIVGSALTPWGPPAFNFSEATNAGYAAFKTTWANRPTVVYFGANDGMMHAVRGDAAVPPGGTEMFAYVPSALYQGPNNTPSIDGLASIGNPSYSHHYFVNATPKAFDIDFNKTAGASGAPNWHTVLIGGLGKGGKSYYAIDVTDPVGMSASESAVAGKVLWEFSDTDLGYSYGDPVVVKTAKYGWVVIFASGYNAADGKGHFLIVNPKTGALLEKVSTNVGAPTTDAGLAYATAFVTDSTDDTADALYGGDLLGNVWRWDLTAASGAYPAPVAIAKLTDASNAAQPVTTAPEIEIDPSTKKRVVLIGTGRMLDSSDTSSSQVQSYYAIFDGTNGRFNATADLPSGVSFPIARANLANDTNTLLTGVSFSANQMGYYIDLGLSSTGTTYRVVTTASTLLGQVAFAGTAPVGSVCSPSGESKTFALAFGTGQTALVNSTGQLLAFSVIAGTVTNIQYVSIGGKRAALFGDNSGTVNSPSISQSTAPAFRRLNWRELQDVN